MMTGTKENPTWVHFGTGNIFRGYIAALQQRLLDAGKAETGIVAVEVYDFEIIDRMFVPCDNLSLLAVMNPDGSLENRVITNIGEAIVGDPSRKDYWGIYEIQIRRTADCFRQYGQLLKKRRKTAQGGYDNRWEIR